MGKAHARRVVGSSDSPAAVEIWRNGADDLTGPAAPQGRDHELYSVASPSINKPARIVGGIDYLAVLPDSFSTLETAHVTVVDVSI